MDQNIHRGFVSELFEIVRLITIIASRKLNFQHVLAFLAFLTFGVGDAVTGAHMMNSVGMGIEANPIIKHLYMNYGTAGMVLGKMLFTLAMILGALFMQWASSEKMYWTVNGFLVAITAGGLMAINANLTATAGLIPTAPGTIIFIYLSLVLVLTQIGGYVDKQTTEMGTYRTGY